MKVGNSAIWFIQTLVHAPTLLALVFSMPASKDLSWFPNLLYSVFTQSLNTILSSTWPQPLATFNPFLAFSSTTYSQRTFLSELYFLGTILIFAKYLMDEIMFNSCRQCHNINSKGDWIVSSSCTVTSLGFSTMSGI